MANPKLEFYKLILNPKSGKGKTFKDFAIEVLGENQTVSDNDAFMANFKHFMKKIGVEHAKDERLKKTITIIDDSETNPFISLKPSFNSSKNIFAGVINGGPYDKDAIVSDVINKNDNKTLDKNKSVLLPYFIFVYIPSDHTEGIFAVHSYSQADSITNIFRSYMANLFKGGNFNKAIFRPFAPKSFQEEFKNNAFIKKFTFDTTIIEDIPSNNQMKTILDEYKIEITATPKGSNKFYLEKAKELLDFFRAKSFKADNRKEVELANFDKTKFTAQNENTKKTKVFEWNTKDQEFVPTIYLKDYVQISDDIPDFVGLKKFCYELFENSLKQEVRPDLYVSKT